MRQKLDAPTAAILKSRVFIARATGKITVSQISQGFGIAGMTLYRYTDERHREKSLVYSRRQTLRKHTRLTSCARCGGRLAEHPRCFACTILLHTTEVFEGGCTSCIDRAHSGELSYGKVVHQTA